ncbi:hypothetical protein CT3_31510 [Comamonas terrigena NBRC 13299]|nr:hypothetical protein CT3_31510 [Comamonas terrigena NBRC 13299]
MGRLSFAANAQGRKGRGRPSKRPIRGMGLVGARGPSVYTVRLRASGGFLAK